MVIAIPSHEVLTMIFAFSYPASQTLCMRTRGNVLKAVPPTDTLSFTAILQCGPNRTMKPTLLRQEECLEESKSPKADFPMIAFSEHHIDSDQPKTACQDTSYSGDNQRIHGKSLGYPE
jgi:hypothetical protein